MNQMREAVVRPIVIFSWRMMAPAPKNPMPVTMPAAMRVGSRWMKVSVSLPMISEM